MTAGKPTAETPIAGRVFAPGGARRSPATLAPGPDDSVTLADADGIVLARVRRAQVGVEAPLGATPRQLRFPDGRLFETDDHAGVDALFGGGLGARLHAWEKPRARLLVLVALAALSGWLCWRHGLDALAAAAVALTPVAAERTLGEQTLASFDRGVAAPSALPPDSRAATRRVFDALVAAMPAADRAGLAPRLEVRRMEGLGPNAFALPGGLVVVTDELVAAFPDADVQAGVLGHELAHAARRHGLRNLYRAIGAGAALTLLIGDAGLVGEELAASGAALLALSYSRAAEAEADRLGAAYARAAGYDPEGLADFLAAIAARDGDGPDWLSTHPAPAARVDALRGARP